MGAPFRAPYVDNNAEKHSDAVDALAKILQSSGVAVTILSAASVEAIDVKEQERLKSLKDSACISVGYTSRWFATVTARNACLNFRSNRECSPFRPLKTEASLLHIMTALGQDAILAVHPTRNESTGPSSGVGIFSVYHREPTAEASIEATLVLKNGVVPWSGSADAEGKLRPEVTAQINAKVNGYLEREIKKMDEWYAAHPDTDPPHDKTSDEKFNAISKGDLEESPEGGTLGPSLEATLHAAALRLLDQLKPVFVMK